MENKIINGYVLPFEEAVELCGSLSARRLGEMADAVRKHFLGNKVDTCSIMNARSGRCSEDCKWCAQSAHFHTGCEVYDYSSVEDALKHAGSHQLTVRRIDIATSGQHQTVRSFLALGHLHPFIPLHEGRIKGTEQDSYGHKPQHSPRQASNQVRFRQYQKLLPLSHSNAFPCRLPLLLFFPVKLL